MKFILRNNPPLFSVFEFYQALFKVFDPNNTYDASVQEAVSDSLIDEHEYKIVEMHGIYYCIKRDVYCFRTVSELDELISQPRNITLEPAKDQNSSEEAHEKSESAHHM